MDKPKSFIAAIKARHDLFRFFGQTIVDMVPESDLRFHATDMIEKYVCSSIITDSTPMAIDCCEHLSKLNEPFIYNDLDCEAYMIKSDNQLVSHAMIHVDQNTQVLYLIHDEHIEDSPSVKNKAMFIYGCDNDSHDSFNNLLKITDSRDDNRATHKEFLGSGFIPHTEVNFYNVTNRNLLKASIMNLEFLHCALTTTKKE